MHHKSRELITGLRIIYRFYSEYIYVNVYTLLHRLYNKILRRSFLTKVNGCIVILHKRSHLQYE